MNLRISTTSIDAWIYTMTHEDSDVEKLMAQLRGEQPQTEPMRVGSAFHKAMELAEPGIAISLEADGYRFTVMPDVELALPAIRELKLETEYVIDSHLTVNLVGKVDGLEGRTVTDHKTTKRFEAEYMLDTFQWRFYLKAANADRFIWNIFVMDEGRLTCDADGKETWDYQIKDFHPLSQYRYPGMEEECDAKLREFLAFLGIDKMQRPGDWTLANLLRANKR